MLVNHVNFSLWVVLSEGYITDEYKLEMAIDNLLKPHNMILMTPQRVSSS